MFPCQCFPSLLLCFVGNGKGYVVDSEVCLRVVTHREEIRVHMDLKSYMVYRTLLIRGLGTVSF